MKVTKIDHVITKVSGSNNYMNDLSSITGNIMTIDREYYLSQLQKIQMANAVIKKNILDLYSKTEEKELKQLVEVFEKKEKELNISNPYQQKVNNKTKKVKNILVLTPKKLYESNWFKFVREIETNCATLISQFEIENGEIQDKQREIFKNNPETLNSFLFYNLRMDNEDVYRTNYLLAKFANKVIEIVLSPAYDAEKFIRNHWMKQIDDVLSNGKGMERKEIQHMVYMFVLAKYRLSLTSDSEEFTKILLKTLDDSSIGNLDAARFLDIVEGIDLEKMDKKENVYKFAEGAKEEIKKILTTKNINPTEILKDIEKLINKEEEETKEESKIEDIF